MLKLDDLTAGLELTGTVLNVVDFGAFVDIGLKDSGLVHVSQLSTRYVKSPHDVVAVGDVITVWVMGVDHERKRVGLTMIKPGTPRQTERPKPQKKPTGQPASRKRVDTRARSIGAKGATHQNKRQRKPRTPKKQERLPDLTQDMVEGSEPLRCFDELKARWKKRKE